MARDLEMTHVGRVVRRREIVVLQDARRVEVMHPVGALAAEVLVHAFDFGDVGRVLGVCVFVVVGVFECCVRLGRWCTGGEVSPKGLHTLLAVD